MSKFGVFSDIHSNVWALEAVLSDAKCRSVDGFINLGDILYGPLAPKETYELLQTETMITIRGNQDRQIYEATNKDVSSNPTMQFILSELGQEPLRWMKNLPAAKLLALERDVLLCHGTPASDSIYLLEDISTGYPIVKSDAEILEQLTRVGESMVLSGHTHIPRLVQLSSGQIVVNPGSVGLPAYYDDQPIPHKMENYSSHASYCTIEFSNFAWQVEQIKVPYPYQVAVQAAKKRNRMDWAVALESGRIMPKQ